MYYCDIISQIKIHTDEKPFLCSERDDHLIRLVLLKDKEKALWVKSILCNCCDFFLENYDFPLD